ncbi:hypothetical protein Tco_0321201 [Tanacetum coccineum]
MVPRTVLTRSCLILVNTARPVNTVQPRTAVSNAGPMKNVINSAYSTARRPFNKITAVNNSNFTKKVILLREQGLILLGQKQLLMLLRETREMLLRPQHGNPQQDLKNKGVIDSGCSRHMTGNISYLINYKEIDGGFVAFGDSKSSPDSGFKPSEEEEKKDAEDLGNKSRNPTEGKDSEAPKVNAVDPKISIELLNDPNMPELKDIVYSDDVENVGAEDDMNNLDTLIPISVTFRI